VGTGGASNYYFLAKEPYMVTQYVGSGFLNVDVIDSGQTFNVIFYTNNGASTINSLLKKLAVPLRKLKKYRDSDKFRFFIVSSIPWLKP
jgi:hypothetical protein